MRYTYARRILQLHSGKNIFKDLKGIVNQIIVIRTVFIFRLVDPDTFIEAKD